MMRFRDCRAALCAVAVVVAATPLAAHTTTAQAGDHVPAITASASFSGHGSIGEAYELGAPPHDSLVLASAAGHVVGRGMTDRFGSLVIYNVKSGSGYTFRHVDGATVTGTEAFRVPSPSDPPPPAGFDSSQQMHVGLNYISMRDGITLAATLRLPLGKTMADGPFPTVIEYSGYAIAAPHDLLGALLAKLANPDSKATDDPLLPDTSTAVGAVVATALGFATVSLQMRGSGCSGGVSDLFGPITTYDGYDAVQIVGSQPWALNHKVGMVGISFSGQSQWEVAGTHPPDLAAIAPMSSEDDLYSIGFPGGMPNTGFAASWIAERVSDAKPAPGGGQPWVTAEINTGDTTCLANQRLRLQTQNLTKLLASNFHRTPSLYDPRSMAAWAKKVRVPVFASGALQDEQTGPEWPALIPSLNGDKNVFVTMINGAHIDSLGPAILTRWLEFLDIFVAGEVPKPTSVLALLGPALYQQIASSPSETMPDLRFTDAASPAAARADFIKDDPRVRVLFDNGGGSVGPGAFQAGWESDFTSWPPPPGKTTTWQLRRNGALSAAEPNPGAVSFKPDPTARPATDLSKDGNAWAPDPGYTWTPVTGSDGLGFISKPMTKDTVIVGPASLNLWVKSTAMDTDLQVTVSDVRVDGKETYVTSGFLRASDRTLDQSRSTALEPVQTFIKSESLPRGKYTRLRIPIDPIAHAFRAGSRLRITISAPGGDRPVWAFATLPTHGKVTDTVSLGGAKASTFAFDVIPGVTPSDSEPACGALRGEPCRTYLAAGNGG